MDVPDLGQVDLASEGSRRVRRIVASVAVSALGTWSYNVGIAVYAYQQTHSTGWVAAATVGRYLPALALTWYGSKWVDRFPKQRVAVVADLVCASAMVFLTVVAVSHGALILAIALAAVSSGVARIQNSAALSLVADLVIESRLISTALWIGTLESVATAAGPAIASVVLAIWSPGALFALNGVTFAGSAALIAGLGTRTAKRRSRSAAIVRTTDPHIGRRAILRVVWPLLVSRTLVAFLYGVDVVLLAVLATERLGQGTGGYGWLLAAAGTGGLIAGVMSRAGRTALRPVIVTSAGLACYALPLLLFAGHLSLAEGLAIQALRGFGCVVVTTAVIASLQRLVPSVASASFFGLTHVLVMSGTCTGAVLVPVLLHAMGLVGTLVVCAAVPAVLQLAVIPALVRMDSEGAAAAASLDPRVNVLRGLALFKDASRSMLYELADAAEPLEAGPGRELVTEGATADALYVLLAGQVEVTGHGAAGPVLFRTMSSPAYFGEIGLIHQVPRTATVTTTTTCSLWRIPAQTFLSVASQAGLSNALTDTAGLRFHADPEQSVLPSAPER